MFQSIFTDTASGLALSSILIAFAVSLACGVFIAMIYRHFEDPGTNLLIGITMLPAIVMGVILMVNGNLGVGVAVAGSFSLIRFRSLPGKATDIAVIFLAMATGLACGTGYVMFAVLMAIIVSGCALIVSHLPAYRISETERIIRITVPEDLDYTDLFEDVLNRYTASHVLQRVKTINLGALYQLDYKVQLKNAAEEKQLLDQMRTRNGNLTVASMLPGLYTDEL